MSYAANLLVQLFFIITIISGILFLAIKSFSKILRIIIGSSLITCGALFLFLMKGNIFCKGHTFLISLPVIVLIGAGLIAFLVKKPRKGLRILVGALLIVTPILTFGYIIFTALLGGISCDNYTTFLPSECDKILCVQCREICYADAVFNQPNLSICDKIDYYWQKNGCITNVAKAQKNASVCEYISIDSWKPGCYSAVANLQLNISLCNTFERFDDVERCYTEIAKSSQNLSYCDAILSINLDSYPSSKSNLRDYCYSYVAGRAKNASICDLLYFDKIKDTCYDEVGISTLNFSMCMMDSRQLGEDACLSEVAIKANNASICPLIETEYWRDECLRKAK